MAVHSEILLWSSGRRLRWSSVVPYIDVERHASVVRIQVSILGPQVSRKINHVDCRSWLDVASHHPLCRHIEYLAYLEQYQIMQTLKWSSQITYFCRSKKLLDT